MSTWLSFSATCGFLAFFLLRSTVLADWRDTIGFTRLELIASSELPDHASGGYAQIEALQAGNYAPDTAAANFSGKTFTLKSGSSNPSNHANTVATRFYGNTTSLLSGPAAVDVYEVNHWLASGFLNRTNLNVAPTTEFRSVQNHSWIGDGLSQSAVEEINRRVDYAIQRDGFVSVVGMNNGNSTTLPQLLGQSYNSISVGRSDGNHSAGFTTLDGAGRIKPELVAPDTATSYSSPQVASAASLLQATLSSSPYSLSGADIPLTVKALLLASARKDRFSTWSNTPTRPLDIRYGAGELNIFHAYSTLRSGRASASAVAAVPSRGWAAESISGNSTKTYYFTIGSSGGSPFTAALTWHRNATPQRSGPNSYAVWNSSLANLDLHLHSASGLIIGPEISASGSTVDNVELVRSTNLPPGDYALVVENLSSASSAYSLAWHSLPEIEVVVTDAVADELTGGSATVLLTRTGDTSLPLYVTLGYSGNAVAGSDYETPPGSVIIPAGATGTSIELNPISDLLAQGERTIVVSAAADFTYTTNQTAEVRIEDKPYDAWRFARFNSAQLGDTAISGPEADPDRDGIANLLEYAFATEPLTANGSSILPQAQIIGGRLGIHFETLRGELAYIPQWSPDMIQWHSGAAYTTEETNGSTITSTSNAALAEHPQQFMRLEISLP